MIFQVPKQLIIKKRYSKSIDHKLRNSIDFVPNFFSKRQEIVQLIKRSKRVCEQKKRYLLKI